MLEGLTEHAIHTGHLAHLVSSMLCNGSINSWDKTASCNQAGQP